MAPKKKVTGLIKLQINAGAANPAGVASFDAATGTQSQIATEYLPSSSGWSGMDGAGGSLSWLTSAWAGKGYLLSVGVPIIPTNSGGNLATGATGAVGAGGGTNLGTAEPG